MYEMTIELSETDVKAALIDYVETNIAHVKDNYQLVETQSRGSSFTDVTLIYKELTITPSTAEG